MKSILAKILALGYLIGLPALANDVGLHNSSAQPTRAMIMAQANSRGQDTGKADRVIGVCHLAQNPANPPSTAVNVIEPVTEVEDYLTKFEHIKVEGSVRFQVLQQPGHGLLRDGGQGTYSYVPEAGYLGNDQATIMVEVSGLEIKVRYFFKVLNSLPTDSDQEKYCPRYKWQISK